MTQAARSISSFIDQERAPYGVIFDGQMKAYVGSPHGKPITLSENLKQRIKSISDKYGVWFEGDGGDIEPNKALFGDKTHYRGSWDDAFNKTIKGYPPEYLSAMFSNVAVNGQKKVFLSSEISIFDSLLKNQSKKRFFKDRAYNADTLKQFLQMVSDDQHNFVKLSQKPATKENISNFFDVGEARMFPKNWNKYPYPAGKVMKKVEDARNQYVLNQPSGVFIMGAGHLIEILGMKRSLSMVGGEKAAL